MNELRESEFTDMFQLAYQDNGIFYVDIWDKNGKDVVNINVSDVLTIKDAESKPITGFWEPVIVACFLPDDRIFIAPYHRIEK